MSTLSKTIDWLEEVGAIDQAEARKQRRANANLPLYAEQSALVPEVGSPEFLQLLNCWMCRAKQHSMDGYPEYTEVSGGGIQLAETCNRCDTLRWYIWNRRTRSDDYDYERSEAYLASRIEGFTGRDYQQLTARMQFELNLHELWLQAVADIEKAEKAELATRA